MLIHRAEPRPLRHPWLRRMLAAAPALVLVLVGGLWLGWQLARGADVARGGAVTPVAPPPAATAPWFPQPRPQEGDLPRLEVLIAPADWQVLAQHRERALAAKFLFADDNAVVPVQLRWGQEVTSGTARLKGDWLDHLDTDQWSLRLEVEPPLHGMRRFSVQHPKTRGYVMEWLVLATARRLGALAPRSHFVQVAINDRPPGVYYLEEHPGKEMLEHQGRRDGPVVKFDEDALWTTHMQMGFLRVGVLPRELDRMYHVFDAPAEVIGAKQAAGLEALQARWQRAMRQARDLQRTIVTQDLDGNPLRHLHELQALEGRTVDELFAAERLGRVLAVLTFFQGFHGLYWNQLRLYHDPVLDRLELVVNDTDANLMTRPGELVVTAPEARWLRSSPRTLVAAYETLGRMTAPGWLEQLIADLRPDLLRATAAMQKAGIEVPGFDLLDALELLLRQQRERLYEFVRPRAAAAFSASIAGVRAPSGEDLRTIDIEARSTSEVPTRVSAFELGNGRRVPAHEVLVGLVGWPNSHAAVAKVSDGGVLLPADGRPVLFRLPIDRRLAGLSEIEAIKRAIRQPLVGLRAAEIMVSAHFRPVAEPIDRRQELVWQPAPDAALARKGRGPAPTLWQALEQHACLQYDLEYGRLQVRPGQHDIIGDLVLPEATVLHLPAGVELRFAADAVMVVGALVVDGTGAQPARLAPQDAAQGFAGVLVLGTAGASQCDHLHVHGATAIARGGWQSTGGIAFLQAPVTLRDCVFGEARGEDALNLIGTRFSMTRCRFTGGPSDLFDGDFVTGEVIDCEFANSGEDAIDVSGAQVVVRGCRFTEIGDKALSVGEGSQLTVQDSHVVSAAIALAAKDRSRATVERLRVDAVQHFVLASYVKKPEFGPAQIVATGLQWGGGGAAPHLVQTGCEASVDGVTIASQDIDVEALYRQQVLGK